MVCERDAGYVRDIDAHVCARVCQHLGAGRSQAGQKLDLAVGLTFSVEVGDYLQAGECAPLAATAAVVSRIAQQTSGT